ncbi:MAG: Mut7-C RNAse domain-containing protein [Nitrosopumilus sp.]|nr:Mut7-C RNAse domain-containing protein [Nitrosopumilus sp.]
MLFFVDAMLGNIAKKLRLLGFDSEYFSDIDDSKLIEKAQNENRIIISRDRHLIDRAKKKEIPSIYITKENEIDQFLEILETINLQLNEISGDISRCTKCNSTTSRISKLKIENKIPQGVLEYNDRFWKCDKCDKIYWEGTHIKNLQEFVHEIKRRSNHL